MSFSPVTGLVYIPSTTTGYFYHPDPEFRFLPGTWNTSEDMNALHLEIESLIDVTTPCSPSHLTAWDPVEDEQRWRVEYDESIPGGILSTAGGLVFQGSGRRFMAYDDRDGTRLWETTTSVGIMAPPITYSIDGVQYIAVVGGLGGTHGGHLSSMDTENRGQIFAFKLGGKAPMPEAIAKAPFAVRYRPTSPPPEDAVTRGRALFARHCFRCHGIGAITQGVYTDLRAATPETHRDWNDIVLGGTRQTKGMPTFADLIDATGAQDIRAYVIARSLHEPSLLERVQRQILEWGCLPVDWVAD